MNLKEALGHIHSAQSSTTLIAGLLGGDSGAIADANAVGLALEQAEEKLRSVRQAQKDCKSDQAWWGYNGQVAYWKAAVDILKAAEITGPENLPDIDPPNKEGVLMDVQHHMERFGERMLKAAKESQDV